jgi:hypothetical protein
MSADGEHWQGRRSCKELGYNSTIQFWRARKITRANHHQMVRSLYEKTGKIKPNGPRPPDVATQLEQSKGPSLYYSKPNT